MMVLPNLASRYESLTESTSARANVIAMPRTTKFLVTLTTGENGFIVAECPSLPGCLSQGRTKKEALANIREAIEASLLTREGMRIPPAPEVVEVKVSVPA